MLWLSKWVNNFEIVGYIFQNVNQLVWEPISFWYVAKDKIDSIPVFHILFLTYSSPYKKGTNFSDGWSMTNPTNTITRKKLVKGQTIFQFLKNNQNESDFLEEDCMFHIFIHVKMFHYQFVVFLWKRSAFNWTKMDLEKRS